MGDRVRAQNIEIDKEKTKKFFDARSKKKLPYLYNYTNYQDKSPELVLQRDSYEKHKILPVLGIEKDMRVLDIGCGVGRWAESVLSHGGIYIGADYSESLLALAREACGAITDGGSRYDFICSSFQNLYENLPVECSAQGFDIIIVNGVMTYINDNELGKCLDNVDALLKTGGLFYGKEPVSYAERLTLNNVYSDELECDYSAIYRSVEEYEKLWAAFGEKYVLLQKGRMYESALNNRKETGAYYWVMRKVCEKD